MSINLADMANTRHKVIPGRENRIACTTRGLTNNPCFVQCPVLSKRNVSATTQGTIKESLRASLGKVTQKPQYASKLSLRVVHLKKYLWEWLTKTTTRQTHVYFLNVETWVAFGAYTHHKIPGKTLVKYNAIWILSHALSIRLKRVPYSCAYGLSFWVLVYRVCGVTYD